MKKLYSARFAILYVVMVAMLTGASVVRAQEVTATITGTVMDPSGAAVADAAVAARAGVGHGGASPDRSIGAGCYRWLISRDNGNTRRAAGGVHPRAGSSPHAFTHFGSQRSHEHTL